MCVCALGVRRRAKQSGRRVSGRLTVVSLSLQEATPTATRNLEPARSSLQARYEFCFGAAYTYATYPFSLRFRTHKLAGYLRGEREFGRNFGGAPDFTYVESLGERGGRH